MMNNEEQWGPELVRDDELTNHLRAIVAPPADASYWDGLHRRILARLERGQAEGRWWAVSERMYQIGLIAAGLTLIVAGSMYLREKAEDRRMAFEAVMETSTQPRLYARRGIVPDHQETLRPVTDH